MFKVIEDSGDAVGVDKDKKNCVAVESACLLLETSSVADRGLLHELTSTKSVMEQAKFIRDLMGLRAVISWDIQRHRVS